MTLHVVFRFEAECEEGVPFPDLASAMCERPSHGESRIATSVDGVVLCEATPESSRKKLRTTYAWQTTVAGEDVLTGCVRGGMRRAS